MDKYLGKLITNLDFETYLRLENYMHSSELKTLQQSINHYLSRTSYKQTDAMKMGSLGHTMILEMEAFSERYKVKQKYDRRKPLEKAEDNRITEEAQKEGLTLITQDEFMLAQTWRDNVNKNPFTSKVFLNSYGENEVSGFYKHPDFEDIYGAFRVDKLIKERKLAIDLKIMLSASPYAFISSVKKFRYDIQAAWYLDGLKELTGDVYEFVFVVCEKGTPNNVQTYTLSEQSLENARADIRAIIKKFTEYRDAPASQKEKLLGYYNGVKTLDIKWY